MNIEIKNQIHQIIDELIKLSEGIENGIIKNKEVDSAFSGNIKIVYDLLEKDTFEYRRFDNWKITNYQTIWTQPKHAEKYAEGDKIIQDLIGILNKLKNIIGAEKITVNEKGVQPYQIENIAWFFISSNSNKPLQLDDRDKGNRRFSIIKSHSKLTNGKEINRAIRSIEKVKNFLAWLHHEYPEVLKYKRLDPLDNQDKRELEERSQNEANNFWDWLEDNYSEIKGKMTKKEVEDYINKYCFENNIDEKEFLKYFWNNSKYSKKKIRIGDKTYYGVEIKNRT